MYIQDKNWDVLVEDCLHLIELIESVPKEIVYPLKTETLALLYDMVHMRDEPLPKPKKNKTRLQEMIAEVKKTFRLK